MFEGGGKFIKLVWILYFSLSVLKMNKKVVKEVKSVVEELRNIILVMDSFKFMVVFIEEYCVVNVNNIGSREIYFLVGEGEVIGWDEERNKFV